MKDLHMETISELVRLVAECNRRKEDADLYFSVRAGYPGRHMPPYPEGDVGLHVEFNITFGIGPVGSETHHYGTNYVEFVLIDDKIKGIVTRRDLREQRSPDKPLTERSVKSLLKTVRAFCDWHLKEHPPLSEKLKRWFHQ